MVFSDNELEFLAEDTPLNIIPNFDLPRLHCVIQDHGPFKPGVPATVPLWLAVQLKRFKTCRLQPPYWLNVDRLKEFISLEQSLPNELQKLPDHYIEVYSLFISIAEDDLQESLFIRSLVEDLQAIRAQKLRVGLHIIDSETQLLKLNNISSMELGQIRGYITSTLYGFWNLRQVSQSQIG